MPLTAGCRQDLYVGFATKGHIPPGDFRKECSDQMTQMSEFGPSSTTSIGRIARSRGGHRPTLDRGEEREEAFAFEELAEFLFLET
jgi:hypothetical protein